MCFRSIALSKSYFLTFHQNIPKSTNLYEKHLNALERQMKLWQGGNSNELLEESKTIQE